MSLSENLQQGRDVRLPGSLQPGTDNPHNPTDLLQGTQTGAGGSSPEGRASRRSPTWSAAVRGPGGVTSGPSLSDEGGNPGEEPPTPVPGGGFSDGRGGGRGDGPPSGAAPFEPGGDGDGDGSGANSPLGALSSDQGHRGSDVPASFGREVQVGDLSQASDLGETDVLTEEWVEPRRSLTEPGYVAYLGKLGNYSFVHIDVGTDKPVTFGQEDHTLSLHLPPDASTEQLTEAIDFVHEKTPGYRPGTGASGEFDLHEQLELAVVDYGIKKLPDVLGTDGWNEANRQALGLPEGDRRSFREVVRDKIGPEREAAVLEEHENLAQGLPRENEASLAEASYVQALAEVIENIPGGENLARPADIAEQQAVNCVGIDELAQVLSDVGIPIKIISLPGHVAAAIRLSSGHVLLEDLARYHWNGPVQDDSIQGVNAQGEVLDRVAISEFINDPDAHPGIRITLSDFYYDLIGYERYTDDPRRRGVIISADRGMQLVILSDIFSPDSILDGEQIDYPSLFYAGTLMQKLEPQYPNTYNYLSEYYRHIDNLDMVNHHRNIMMTFDPDSPTSIIIQGNIYAESGDYENAAIYYQKVITMVPDKSDIHSTWAGLATALHRQGRGSEAIACIDEAIKIKPKRAEYHYLRALIYYELDNWDATSLNIENAVELAGDNMVYVSYLALAQARIGNSDAARERIQQALQQTPENAEVQGHAALISVLDSDLDSARSHLREAFTISAADPKQALDYAVIELGNILEQQGQVIEAISLYSTIVEADPTNHLAWHELATFQMINDAPEDALRSVTTALDLSADDTMYLETRARVYLDLKQWPEALADYKRLTELEPDETEPWRNYAWTLWKNGQTDEAIALYAHLIEENDEDPINYRNLGMIYSDLGNYNLADAAYTNALARISPDDTELTRNFTVEHAGMFFKAGDYRRAEEMVAPIVAGHPDYAGGTYLLGRTQVGQGNYDSAVATYTTFLESHANDFVALNNRGNVYTQQGNLPEALIDFDHALSLEPNNMRVLKNKVRCLCDLNRYGDAVTEIQEHLNTDPNSPALYQLLTLVYFDNNDYRSGVAASQQALQYVNPENTAVKANILSMLSLGLSKTERHTEAIQTSFEAHQLQPDEPALERNYARALYNYARMLSRNGQTDQASKYYVEAVQIFEDLIQTESSDPISYYELAYIMALQGDIQESERYAALAKERLSTENITYTLEIVEEAMNGMYELWQQQRESQR